jgi:hypothetical protein
MKRAGKAPAPKRARWFKNQAFPLHYAYCPDERTWNDEMRALKIEGEVYPTTHGRTTTFVRSSGDMIAIVTISPEARAKGEKNLAGLVALMAHEAMHVFQHLCEDIGERSPSIEFEAYMLQDILADLLHAYATAHNVKALRQK